MAITYLDNVDLKQNQLLNPVIHVLSSAPGSPRLGQIYFASQGNSNTIVQWNGNEWVPLDARQATNIPVSALVSSQLTSAIQAVTLDTMAAPAANVSLANHNLTNVASPVSNTDAANKAYVLATAQSAASGLSVKDAVVVATTANITLSGLQTIDGISVTGGQRVLVKNQSNAALNGIYNANSGAWTVASDSVTGELISGSLVLSVKGSTQSGTQWYLTTSDPITVGTTNQVWTQFGAAGTYTADSAGGLQLVGSAFSVKTPDNSGLVADSTGLYVNNSIYPRKYSANVGDGSSTTVVFTHNLGTQDVIVQLRNNASPYDVQYATVECTNTSAVTLMFSVAPTLNSLRATVIG